MGPIKAEDSFLEFCFQYPSRNSNVTRIVPSALFAPFCADTSHTKITLIISVASYLETKQIITKKILRIEVACDICDSLLMQLSGDITSLLK